MTISILTQPLLSVNSVRLGRLVLDINAPWQDYRPKSPIQLTSEDVLVTPFLHINEVMEATHGTKFHANLSEAVSGSLAKQRTSIARITAPRGMTYTLFNSGDHFQRICRDADVRTWIEQAIKFGIHVYMVVGFITLTDAKVVGSIRTTSQMQGDASVPVTDIVTSGVGAIVPSTLGTILDSGIGVDKLIRDVANATYYSPGEKVFALQYRKVKYEWFNSKSVDTAFLEKGNRWIIQGGYRETLEEEEVIAADLEETTSAEDMEIKYETYRIVDGIEFLLIEHK